MKSGATDTGGPSGQIKFKAGNRIPWATVNGLVAHVVKAPGDQVKPPKALCGLWLVRLRVLSDAELVTTVECVRCRGILDTWTKAREQAEWHEKWGDGIPKEPGRYWYYFDGNWGIYYVSPYPMSKGRPLHVWNAADYYDYPPPKPISEFDPTKWGPRILPPENPPPERIQ